MRHQNSVFHQLTKPLPWAVFRRRRGGARRRPRECASCAPRDQFLALLYAQFSGAASLREIEAGLASQKVRLYHAGLRPVSRSTLADANARRSCAVLWRRLRRDGAPRPAGRAAQAAAGRCACWTRPRSSCGARARRGRGSRRITAGPSCMSSMTPMTGCRDTPR